MIGTLGFEQRVLRFTGLGDDEGLAAAAAWSAALRAGAERCLELQRPRLSVLGDTADDPLPERHGTDVLLTGVDEGDGTWTTTATARDGVTVLVLTERSTAPMGWSEGLALGLLEQAWSRVRAADRAPGATEGLVPTE